MLPLPSDGLSNFFMLFVFYSALKHFLAFYLNILGCCKAIIQRCKNSSWHVIWTTYMQYNLFFGRCHSSLDCETLIHVSLIPLLAHQNQEARNGITNVYYGNQWNCLGAQFYSM
ncbi:peroxisomal multifunctional enzyme type 2 [Platysternon megacephalum]|uniref:Peroxisomal multifunctional enzyme type 2 n=1 Tax=Platysternon megacephalum TaxID=55544 RepID=A0A4D9EVB3_9SAUR|nr:peroxisomal multifunctional enzyme type 2 [Platysternon megacephalum]